MKKTFSIKDPNQRQWMVIYTRSNYEKKIDRLLGMQQIEGYCPLLKSKKKWADRQVMIERPLFPSYVFVHVNLHEQLRVLQTAGVVGFVQYNGKPAMLSSADIDRVKEIVQQFSETEIEILSLRNIRIGDHVAVKEGLFVNTLGEVVEVHGRSVLVILKQLDCALAAKVKLNYDQFVLQ